MRVLFISDFGIHHNQGGAQRSNEIIRVAGEARGHEIVMCHYDSGLEPFRGHYDVIISSNLEQFNHSNRNAVDFCCQVPNHVRLEHDMCRYLSPDKRKALYGNCQKTFFLTPHHHQKFIEFYGTHCEFRNVHIVPDPIDGKVFYDQGLERESKTLYLGFMHPLKGTDNFLRHIKEEPDTKFVAAAWGPENYTQALQDAPNVEFLGQLPYEEVPALLNRYDSLFCCPEMDEPFCRSVGEALLCGITEFVANEKVGSLNMAQTDPDFKTKCLNAHNDFWEILDD